MQACPLDIEPNEYQKRIINEMAQTYAGIQKVSTSPDLYLPRQELFLRTSLRQMPLDPLSEEGQVEIKRMEGVVDTGAHRTDRRNVDAWNPLIEKMKLIYGWDAHFGRDLVRGVLSLLEDRRKAERESEERRMHDG